jgi:hypothetical protein
MGDVDPQHVRFLWEHGRQVVAAAERGFVRAGRGAVLVAPTEPDRLHYAADADVEATGLGWGERPIERMVRDYDPDRQMVVIFVPDDRPACTYKIDVRPPRPRRCPVRPEDGA